jgi:hypothetical protein
MVNRMLASQRRERDIILAEVADLRGFMPLLMKHRNGGRWSREERAALHRQFQALRHISPYLVVIILPGSFAMLPVLAWWLDRRRLRRDSASLSMPGA